MKMGISIFARPYFMGVDEDSPTVPYLHRGTSFIRGQQIAEFLGAKYNPTSGYEEDLKIYLKPKSLDLIADGDYIDVSDSGEFIIEHLKKRPKLKVIASSLATYEILKEKLPNKVILIPEHHCNFESTKRVKNQITTVGYVGSPNKFIFSMNPEIEKRLKKIGLELLALYYFKERLDVINFYRQIDLQIIPHFWPDDSEIYRHPTKMISAASFGIPTIAANKSGYKEWAGKFVVASDINSLISEVQKFKNKKYYEENVSKIISVSEPYHIENIAKLYRKL